MKGIVVQRALANHWTGQNFAVHLPFAQSAELFVKFEGKCKAMMPAGNERGRNLAAHAEFIRRQTEAQLEAACTSIIAARAEEMAAKASIATADATK